jgi:cyclopropane-fatty-acyl-phospholipid synthase
MLDLGQKRLEAARRLVEQVAAELGADLSVRLWDGTVLPLGPGARDDIRLAVNTPAALRRLILSPKLMTLFELYGAGDFDIEGGSPLEAARRWDHIRALRLARTLDKRKLAGALWPFLVGRSAPGEAPGFDRPVEAKLARGRDDKTLIQFHYDLSNAFYGLFLDPEMVYSSGYFAGPDTSLDEAQAAKIDLTCRKLRLQPGDRFLEIGCGWGGVICHAAKVYGVTGHGITLSQAQLDFAKDKIRRLGLENQITVELKEYGAVEGEYDKIASIGMFEHVGLDNHDAYFSKIHALLRPRGLYLHQATTRMATRDLRRFRKRTAYQDVITRFIFPGGELDYVGLTATNLERLGFEVIDVETWREHYQRTLEHWAERLYARREEAQAEVGPARTRLWLLYFALFALAFERNTVSDFQVLASKRRRGPSGLPWSRADLYA